MAIGDRPGSVPTEDDRHQPMSEHTILVVTSVDRPVESWTGDAAVIGPDRGAEFGLEPDGGAVVAAVDPEEGAVVRSERLSAPLNPDGLREAIDRLDRRARYDALLAEYARLAARRGRLEAERDGSELAEDRKYRGLCRRLADVEDELDGLTRTFDGADFRAAFETAGLGGACKRAD